MAAPSPPRDPEDPAPKPKGTTDGARARVDAVRRAVDGALTVAAGGAAGSRERVFELAEEVARAAARLRGAVEEAGPAAGEEIQQAGARLLRAVDDLRPVGGDEARRLRERVAELEERVRVLEAAAPDRS